MAKSFSVTLKNRKGKAVFREAELEKKTGILRESGKCPWGLFSKFSIDTREDPEGPHHILNQSTIPSFKELTIESLAELRRMVYFKKDEKLISIWSEKLLRFCEVRYFELWKRALAKWEDEEFAQFGLLYLALFFLDVYELLRDPRFLNICLKIQDIRQLHARCGFKRSQNESQYIKLSSRAGELVQEKLEETLRCMVGDPNGKKQCNPLFAE